MLSKLFDVLNYYQLFIITLWI